jgi:16S rRNA (cytidine1402-2'-O)-methyltransferase
MLYLVATPIGNLKDITLRALEVLKAADAIACEDTRRTGQLLKHYEISSKLLSFHDHSGPGRIREIISLLKEGKDVALVTDGGTPLVSDPGFPLVREAIREKIRVEAVPGPSSVAAGLVTSGLATERFTFWGFLPAKSGRRRKELQEAADLEHTLVFFESPHRLAALLGEMVEIFGDREAVVARELTKKFEEIIRGTLAELAERFKGKKVLGEIVVVVAGRGRKKVFS